jgi:hypothetical protein
MNENKDCPDKRSSPRISEEVVVDVNIISYPFKEGSGEQGMLKDVAEGGLSFKSSVPYEPGTLLQLKIHLAGWQRHKKSYTRIIDDHVAVAPLTAIAKVVRCHFIPDKNNYEIGGKFVDIYEDDYQAMTKHLKNMLP